MSDLRLPTMHEWITMFRLLAAGVRELHESYPFHQQDDYADPQPLQSVPLRLLYDTTNAVGRESLDLPAKLDYYEPFRAARFIANAYAPQEDFLIHDAATVYALATRDGIDTRSLSEIFSELPFQLTEVPSFLGKAVLGGVFYLWSDIQDVRFAQEPMLEYIKAHGVYPGDLPTNAGQLVHSWLLEAREEPLLSFEDWARREHQAR